MSTDPADQLANALKDWEAQYQAARTQLTLQGIHALRDLVTRLVEMVERDATGPSSSPVMMPDGDE
jgi:hypothetical protein